MINRQLIVLECQRQHITITRTDVDREIQRMAKRFGLPVDQWLTLLKQERNIDVEQYASDIIWPSLALARLAGPRLNVTPDELQQYFEMCHGEKVAARLICVRRSAMAEKVRAQAAAHPEDFAKLAKQYSEDVNSASIGGLIQPIRRHGAYKEIEQAAFSLADGEVSKVIPAGGQYVILKRESLLPPATSGWRSGAAAEGNPPREEDARRRRRGFRRAAEAGDHRTSSWKTRKNSSRCRASRPSSTACRSRSANWPRSASPGTAPKCSKARSAGKLIEQACKQQNVTVSERKSTTK